MKKLLLLALFLFPAFAHAEHQSSTIQGYITSVYNGKKIFLVKLQNNVVEGCNTTGRYAFNEDNLNHEAIISAIISSYHAGETVRINYTKACNAIGNSYDLNYICVGSIAC